MTSPAQAVIDQASIGLMFNSVVAPDNALAQAGKLRQSALNLVATLAPRDAVEAVLAVQMVAMHHATMHGLAQAMQPELGDNLVLRHRGKAFAAAKLMDRTLEWLERRQVMPARGKAGMPEVEMLEQVVVTPAVPAEVPEVERSEPMVEQVAAPAIERPAVPARATPSAAAPGALVYRETRRRELEARVAQGKALTGAQQEWLRRETARQAEASVQALAA